MLGRLCRAAALTAGVVAVIIGLSGGAEAKTPRFPPPGGCIRAMECVNWPIGCLWSQCVDLAGQCPPMLCVPTVAIHCECAAPCDVCCDSGVQNMQPGFIYTLTNVVPDPLCPPWMLCCIFKRTPQPCMALYQVCF